MKTIKTLIIVITVLLLSSCAGTYPYVYKNQNKQRKHKSIAKTYPVIKRQGGVDSHNCHVYKHDNSIRKFPR